MSIRLGVFHLGSYVGVFIILICLRFFLVIKKIMVGNSRQLQHRPCLE